MHPPTHSCFVPNFDGRLVAFLRFDARGYRSKIAVVEFDAATGSFSDEPFTTLDTTLEFTCMCFVRCDDGSDALLAIEGETVIEYNVCTKLVERDIDVKCDYAAPASIYCAGDAIVVQYDNGSVRVYSYSSGKVKVIMPDLMFRKLPVYALSPDGSLLFCLVSTPSAHLYTIFIMSTCTGERHQTGVTIDSVHHPGSMLLCADGSFVVSFGRTVRVYSGAGEQKEQLHGPFRGRGRCAALMYMPSVGGIVMFSSLRTVVVLLEDAWYTSLRCAFVEACVS
jgi:hypothetical protein